MNPLSRTKCFPKNPFKGIVFKRLKSSDCGKDACCGLRQDCKDVPCKEKKECHEVVFGPKIECGCWVYDKTCICDPCPLPLFDWLYYRPSDKKTRKYQKTWIDCPPVKKIRCHYCELPQFPPFKKRIMKARDVCRPPTACERDEKKFEFICKPEKKSKCPYIEAPCCEPGRHPPSCKKPRGPADCCKTCCPYPSYSECCVSGFAFIPGRGEQCFCWDRPSLCILIREMEKARSVKKV